MPNSEAPTPSSHPAGSPIATLLLPVRALAELTAALHARLAPDSPERLASALGPPAPVAPPVALPPWPLPPATIRSPRPGEVGGSSTGPMPSRELLQPLASERGRLLVVDDDREKRQLLKDHLEQLGHEV